MSDQSSQLEVRRFGSPEATRLAALIWPVYDEVFGDFDDFEDLERRPVQAARHPERLPARRRHRRRRP